MIPLPFQNNKKPGDISTKQFAQISGDRETLNQKLIPATANLKTYCNYHLCSESQAKCQA